MRKFASKEAVKGVQRFFALLGERGGVLHAADSGMIVDIHVDEDPMEDGRIKSTIEFVDRSLDGDALETVTFTTAMKIGKKITEVELFSLIIRKDDTEQVLYADDTCVENGVRSKTDIGLDTMFDIYINFIISCPKKYLEAYTHKEYLSKGLRKISLKDASPYELLHTRQGLKYLVENGLAERDEHGFYSIDFFGVMNLAAENNGKDPGYWFKGM
ncbi:MAG: hypothetical protein K6E56_06165 [Lachnospiraceae bacterium]|nr:hypothetical protein [Lachnospiraceae bacterium]